MERHQSNVEVNKFECEEKSALHRPLPVWRSPYTTDIDVPQYKPVKPNLTPKPNSTPRPNITPTTGRSSVYSIDPSPIMLDEIQKPHRFTSTAEQLDKMTQENQVVRPKPVSARTLCDATQYYTATTAAPCHNNNDRSHVQPEFCRRMEMTEEMECSEQHYMNVSKSVTMYDDRTILDQSMESIPRATSHQQPQYTQQPKIPPPATPTKFTPGEFRDSDYDNGADAFKIRPLWTPHHFDGDDGLDSLRFRHVAAPTPNRCASMESE